MELKIDGEVVEVDRVRKGGYLPLIEEGRAEYYLAEDHDEAGKAARKYWKDLAENDPEEFVTLVGKETLVKWAMGQRAGPGSTQVRNLEEWLDLWLDTPEEEFAGYDGEECDVTDADEELIEELGFTPTVAYRCN